MFFLFFVTFIQVFLFHSTLSVLKIPSIKNNCSHNLFCQSFKNCISFLLVLIFLLVFFINISLICIFVFLSAIRGWKSSGNGSSTAVSFKRIFPTRIDALVQMIKMQTMMMLMMMPIMTLMMTALAMMVMLGDRSKKIRDYLGFFPNRGGLPNPKTFVIWPSNFWHAKIILRC